MNYLSNPIFNVLSKIRWNFHLVFTFPDIYQRNTSLNAIRLRKDTFYNFISRLSGFVKIPSKKQIFTFSDEISTSENGHIHALYKLPEKYQRKDQEFITGAKGICTAALRQSKADSGRSNPLSMGRAVPSRPLPPIYQIFRDKIGSIVQIFLFGIALWPLVITTR
jgi:hypothetical protein